MSIEIPDTLPPGPPLALALGSLTFILEMTAWRDEQGHTIPRIGTLTQTGTPSRLLQRLWIDQREREYKGSQTG